MANWISIAVNAGVVIMALLVFTARLEGRISKIETDIRWLKLFVQNGGKDK